MLWPFKLLPIPSVTVSGTKHGYDVIVINHNHTVLRSGGLVMCILCNLPLLQIILEQLNTTYVDLLLIHWPGPPGDSVDPDCKGPNVNYTKCRLNTWRAMEEILKAGTAYAIGVSNYEENHLDEILNTPGLLRPSVNQVEFHPYWQERDLLQ